MASRGRPRHPDILTPREWEVLELLRSGASNAHIAERLGVTERTAKFHVSEILSKLGVASREEAASLPIPERRRWWTAWPLWARIAGAATMAVAGVGFAVLAWGLLRTGVPTDAQRGSTAPQRGTVLASATDPVAWVDLRTSSDARPFTIPGVPACQAVDLIMDLISAGSSEDPNARSSWLILVRNKGAPCFLGSTLDVGFASADGRLSVSEERTGGDIVYIENGPQYGISTPAHRFTYKAYGNITSSPCTVAPVTNLQISPGPILGSVGVNASAGIGWGRCAGETYRAELHPEDCCSGSGYAVQTEIDAAAVAHPGERFRFLMTVINDPPVTSLPAGSHQAPPSLLEWAQCPTYHQELQGVTGSFSTYRLNCDQVNPLPPYASATFEMYIDVPANAQPGPSVLSFGFDDSQATYEETSINVWIEP